MVNSIKEPGGVNELKEKIIHVEKCSPERHPSSFPGGRKSFIPGPLGVTLIELLLQISILVVAQSLS